MDNFVDDPSSMYQVGQSVIAYVSSIEENRVSLSLKQSLAASRDTLFLESFFREQERLDAAHAKGAGAAGPNWGAYPLGGVVDTTIAVVQDYGSVLSFSDDRVKGFVVSAQAKVTPPSLFFVAFSLLLLDDISSDTSCMITTNYLIIDKSDTLYNSFYLFSYFMGKLINSLFFIFPLLCRE